MLEDVLLLAGHECPFSIWMSHVPDCSLPSVDNISSADTKIQFLFRSSKRTPQKVVLSKHKAFFCCSMKALSGSLKSQPSCNDLTKLVL